MSGTRFAITLLLLLILVVLCPSSVAEASAVKESTDYEATSFVPTVLPMPSGTHPDMFGAHTAIDETTLVVSAVCETPETSDTLYQSCAYIYEQRDGTWQVVAKLTVTDEDPSGGYQWSLAIDGDLIVAGNAGATIDDNLTQGIAYLFEKPAGGWVDMTEVALLMATDGGLHSNFGFSVDVADDIVVVGAPSHDNGSDGSREGAAYVFQAPAAGWSDMNETQKLYRPDGRDSEMLGANVGVDAGTIVVRYKDLAPDLVEAIFVFEQSGTEWVQTALLTASDGEEDHLGTALTIQDDLIVAGAYGDDIDGDVDRGSVYLFQRPAAGWVDMTETTKLMASDGQAAQRFGNSVDLHQDTLAVGTWDPVSNTMPTVYLFRHVPVGWQETIWLESAPAEDQSCCFMVGDIGLAEDTVVVRLGTVGTAGWPTTDSVAVFDVTLRHKAFLPLLLANSAESVR